MAASAVRRRDGAIDPCTDCYDGVLRIGIHTSIAKSLENSAALAHELGANTFQIFSASPRQWRASLPETSDVKRFRAARERLDLMPVVIHTNSRRTTSGGTPRIVEVIGATVAVDKVNEEAVLNGIASDAQHDRLFVTGKQWPWIFEIKIVNNSPAK
jgi:hypothetical protein